MEHALLDLANAYIDSTNALVFLTGKAGTGKTTFLRQIRQTSTKKLAVVAPTGVAAINAGGMTIHSMFQLPFGPLLPGLAEGPENKYDPEKRELLQTLELLIIDEISMVRPDVLDQIDMILRNLRGNTFPFGGIQLLMIGDLAQLSPIIRMEEWPLLRPYYDSPYFFSSQVLRKHTFVRIELETVYRQSDPVFVKILNAIRDQEISESALEILNTRHIPDFIPGTDQPFITLSTHNRMVQELNAERLGALDGDEISYRAVVRGEFPADAFPTDTMLKLKVGAQVMFVKNDSSAEKRYYNGKIGSVTRLETDTVYVTSPNGQELAVQAVEWTNIKYELTGDTVSEDNAGSFAQIPLKHAWAITVHKSQGLTFDRAIIDVSEAFTHGQAYVALSRCRSLEGLVLRSPVTMRNVIADPAVLRFNAQTVHLSANRQTLVQHQEEYRLFLLSELFNFSTWKEHVLKFKELMPNAETEILSVAEKMSAALAMYSDERIRKASNYFKEKLELMTAALQPGLPGLVGTSRELAADADQLLQWIIDRCALLEQFSSATFSTSVYLETRRKSTKLSNSLLKKLNARPNEELLEQLMNWRERTAQSENILGSMLFTEQTIALVAAKLPQTLKSLSGIKGVGPEKTNRYGAAILTMIRAYEEQRNGATEQVRLF
ncbi:AAA family ATPase [Mucilaginibacter achroorhodeus]|uniref:AAA family ATPase n=1 Tax=Mucilaginibacter achroorhodeus TaxID=2599294 RepID=A0A563U629_9SPHI|nr:HRDC domain-containing protein [Mucilaginibacter achroorhodeus]TWR26769.1 AAA family ATPase [Mucilaginibacter achroorhodeus]